MGGYSAKLAEMSITIEINPWRQWGSQSMRKTQWVGEKGVAKSQAWFSLLLAPIYTFYDIRTLLGTGRTQW